ncbi:protein LEG1 homolog [Nannospalax galili]|uniref:protein LEG1 homolog n=1 Tax=Nannospalax galili TaxID=1026970 RepID=UPI00111C8244|nr:protein LEG1 homolog [Nannospalax galili]
MKETRKYFTQFGPNNTGNVLWALVLFYGKLYKTDRFADPSNISVCAYDAVSPGCLSINSGWGGISFYVNVINLLGAIECGFLRNMPHEVVLLSREEHRSDFCYSIEECRALYPEAMDAANRFYQYLQSRKSLLTISNIPVYDTDQDLAIHLMWEAHQAAIDVGLPKFTDISQHFSEAERNFTVDFLIAIEFCEAVRYRSHFNGSEEFLVGFPHRLLTDQENAILANDLSTREKALLTAVALISKINEVTGDSSIMHYVKKEWR